MSSDNPFERLFRLGSSIDKMVVDGNLDPEKVANHMQHIVDNPKEFRVNKFALLCDLGTITVPENYEHATCLTRFTEENRKKFSGFNSKITDTNFSNPSRVLRPGDKLQVQAFEQVVPGTTTSVERMHFLRSLNAVFVGAQGLSLVIEQVGEKLPKGNEGYSSFDEPDRLWEDDRGVHRVPHVDVHSDGGFYWHLGAFEHVWLEYSAFLCFRVVE